MHGNDNRDYEFLEW